MKNENKLSNLIHTFQYGYTKYDFLLAKDDNIGVNGENLSIVALTFNRSDATIKLLDSIKNCLPNFAGKIVLADNGSSISELKNIEEYIKKSPLTINLVKFDKNYGVAGGRNRIIKYIETDWIMNLDNDIYFINNPLKIINKTIALLGVKFLNLPLLSENKKTIFSNGGSLFVDIDDENVILGGGSMYEQEKVDNLNQLEPSLSTFLLGGASVINKQAFIECGMFDDNMFIGFEDLDFSIAIFNKGLKIGNCPTLSLVHNHTIKTDENSIEYEKMRFNHGILKDSAQYFENKHGFKIWNVNLEMWIKQRQKDLGIFEKSNLPKTLKNNKMKNKKKKILLVVDVENWCFWNISKRIKENLSNYFEISIISLDIIDNNLIRLLFLARKYDLVHFFWRGHLSFLEDYKDYCRECGLSYEGFVELYIKPQKITTSVYDHLYLDDIKFTNKILKYCQNYTVSSKKLYDIYNKEDKIIKKPQMIVTDGVDLKLFKPQNLERLTTDKKIVIGWVGNSAWASDQEDFKGFNTIIKPLVDELIKEGYPIDFKFADRQVKMTPYEEMPLYYSKIDLYLCASKIEGTPNPILESMACGVPIITTDVGIVKEAFGKKQRQFIVKERTKEAFKEQVIKLINNRDLMKELSEENLIQIQNWDWPIIMKKFHKFFLSNLKEEKK